MILHVKITSISKYSTIEDHEEVPKVEDEVVNLEPSDSNHDKDMVYIPHKIALDEAFNEWGTTNQSKDGSNVHGGLHNFTSIQMEFVQKEHKDKRLWWDIVC